MTPPSIARAYEAIIQADTFKAECPDAYKVVRMEIVDEVVEALRDQALPGSGVSRGYIRAADFIEREYTKENA